MLHPRHHLIHLTDAGWQHQLSQATDARAHEALARWREHGWPAVLRRADADVAPGQWCAGIALPPDAQGNKPRIALRVRDEDVAAQCAPLLLEDIVTRLDASADASALPAAWPAALADMQGQLGRACITLSVFGSLAWQAITGDVYLRAGSDIDLLFRPASRAQLEQGVRLLAYHAMFLPLDGEIVFPGDAAVSWKEWRQVAVKGADPDNKVLLKTPDSVRLERVGALAYSLPAEDGEMSGGARCAA